MTSSNAKRRLALAAVALFAGAAAAQQYVTRSDVEAFFNARFTGAAAIQNHKVEPPDAAVLESGLSVRANIRPFNFFNGRHYCVDDFHLLGIADDEIVDPTFPLEATLQSTYDATAQYTSQMWLDGAALAVESTPVKRLNPAVGQGWWIAFGKIAAPGELAAGFHEFRLVLSNPVLDPFSGSFDNTIGFCVDPSGSPACRLQEDDKPIVGLPCGGGS